MALVTERLFVVEGATVSVIYDDVTGIVSAVAWSNPTSRALVVRASLPDGSRSWSGTIPANSTAQVATPTNPNRRFTCVRGVDSGDGDLLAWVRQFNISVGG